MIPSLLSETMAHLCTRSAAAVVARGRLASPALNAMLLRRLSALPGGKDSLFSAPVFEAARIWEEAGNTLGDLSGQLLHHRLVDALDGARNEKMPRDRHPYNHQLTAWEEAANGNSFLVTSGTGSGKTECFMIPMLDGLLRDPAKGRLSGVRAIVIYPLNALIESQRERLNAWTEGLKDRVTFALYNGLTPETRRQVNRELGGAELGDRRSIRDDPPSILITNVTMLEYLLLRAKDKSILDRSYGLLRWIVLDEAHGYIGAQAAEMALLLRRVRAAFGVEPDQVQLMATSATISEGNAKETEAKLKRFVADLAGVEEGRVRVIEGREAEPELPPPGSDSPLDPSGLSRLSPQELWERLAPHPRVNRLRLDIKSKGLRLPRISEILFDCADHQDKAQAVLDAAAQARDPQGRLLLPWRVHLFQRAQGGLWACIDPNCRYRDPELADSNAGWEFGAVWLAQRDHCECGAPVFEILACTECGTTCLVAGRESGAAARLIPHRGAQTDEFLIDEEPDPEEESIPLVRDTVWLRPARKTVSDRHVCVEDGRLYDNGAPENTRSIAVDVIERAEDRRCCANAAKARLAPQRYGAPFFMGAVLPDILERLAPPLDKPGLPMGGRRAITFSDSRQGVARIAAKLQQDAERTLTRSFLYHVVQEERGLSTEERAKKEAKLQKLIIINDPSFDEDIKSLKEALSGSSKPVPWNDLITRFGGQAELKDFATRVWAERAWGGQQMAETPTKLAEMFLYRELFRRPRVQNNAETMGLVRLVFPELESRALLSVPRVLQDVGIDAESWAGLAQAALDAVFRDSLAIDIGDAGIVRWVSPRWGRIQAICRADLASQDMPTGSRSWPGAKLHPSNPARLGLLIYRLIRGDPDNPVDQDRAREVLDALWILITATAARDTGRGAWRLDFSKAAVARLDRGWLCPVTRRVLGYTTGGPSPYGPRDERLLAPVEFPRLPHANAGGLDQPEREGVERWCTNDACVAKLRSQGLWTDLHDRIASYPRFLLAQEHSAQIERPVLQRYEERFKDGEINLLNCSTTMEMGVDIPNVALVANSNVPPSISNYRQRAGRGGRRGEPWAFAMTFCRDLPLDHVVFQDPLKFLAAPSAAPAVRLDSASVVHRHIHAALLGAFLRASPDGFNIKTSTGAFFGAHLEDVSAPVTADNLADTFFSRLRDADFINTQKDHLARLVSGSVLAQHEAIHLCAEAAEAFEQLLRRWRTEYEKLLERAASATEQEVRTAFEFRARRMHGEFLLSELARRGFTPSYGFPVDVVGFDHLSGHRDTAHHERITFGEYQGGASRTLDVALREYAPGAEVVIDGLVHQSEGLLPAWSAMADASRLEDLQVLWECKSCRQFDIVRTLQDVPEECPHCGASQPCKYNILRPAGFLGRRAPHTGYENLCHVPFEMPRIAARTPWQALPDSGAGRMRSDGAGHVVTQSSGPNGMGYALCLCCGRAEAETDDLSSPSMLKDHKPLAPLPPEQLVKGACPGGLTQRTRIQRNLRLVQETRTDVFELQMPADATRAQALALAAGLREALAERLGAEAREIGLATARSSGAAGEPGYSAFLYDKAAGGAGLVTRLTEFDWFKSCLERAITWLDCQEKCDHGCPACILRPDMNFGEEFPDRPGAHELAQAIFTRLNLPAKLQVFGPGTRLIGQSLIDWLDRQRLSGRLRSLTLYLHAPPLEWELAEWPVADFLKRAAETATYVTLVISTRTLTDKNFEMAQKLDLHRLCGQATLAMIPNLPKVAGLPLLAIVETETETVGIAATDPADATPGPQWGLGQTGPMVFGAAGEPIGMKPVTTDHLVELSSGNARLIRLRNELDGLAAEFGTKFWKALEKADPITIAAAKENGVTQAIYQDRYLLTPLNFKLLYEVLATLPGKDTTTQIKISTAQLDRTAQAGYQVHHSYSSEQDRRVVLEKLFPRAEVSILPKVKQPHARSLELKLNDGRRLIVMLDQGFGAWRTDDSTRHEFRETPDKQAMKIKQNDIRLHMGEKNGAPVIMEFL